MSELCYYIVFRNSKNRRAYYNLDITVSDPYDHARVRRFDQMLLRTLNKIFRERCLTSGQIRKLIRTSEKNSKNKNSIFMLILKQEPALGKLLLKRRKLSLLWIAVLSCYQESAELLVHFGADLNELYGLNSPYEYNLSKTSTLLHALLQMYPSSWNERFIDLAIMDHGVDLSARDSLDRTILHFATKRGRVKAVKMLLEKGADVNAVSLEIMTPLLNAAGNSKADELLPLLRKYGADITAKDACDRNILSYLPFSRNKKNVELVRVLIEKGLSPTEVAPGHNQPLHMAVITEDIKLVNLFLDHGANINARGDCGEFPLNIATECKNLKILLTLLYRGANIDLKEPIDGHTVLHHLGGSDEKTLKMVKILMSVGADIFARAHDGSSFFDIMCRINNMKHPTKRLMLKTLALEKTCMQPSFESKAERIMKEKYPESRKLHQECIEEIVRLKDARFIESCSFYDLLTKCQCEIAPLMRNCDFERNFRLCDLSIFSPMYAEDILGAFERAKHFHRLILEQEDLINEAFDYILPYIIARKVTSCALDCKICELKRIVYASRGIPM